jgi:hypothetical protein
MEMSINQTVTKLFFSKAFFERPGHDFGNRGPSAVLIEYPE